MVTIYFGVYLHYSLIIQKYILADFPGCSTMDWPSIHYRTKRFITLHKEITFKLFF